MKILFTGGGSGGHFYPIIAVAQKLNIMLEREKIVGAKLYYMSTEPYNERMLYDNKITFQRITAGKLRTYFSLQNLLDLFKMAWGVFGAFFKVFTLYPDVVFSKGSFASFPALVAARFFRIPVIIHESDSVPGRVNVWAGKFAQKIAISYPEAAKFFPPGRTALTGNPIREDLMRPSGLDAFRELGLDHSVPVILVLGGSQGAQKINGHMVSLAPRLVERYQVIHQTGEANATEVQELISGLLTRASYEHHEGNHNASRYHVYGYLDSKKMRLAAEVATIVVSRSGSAIFEIANWGIPALLVPITNSHGNHQRENAFAYARAGGAVVVEEENLTQNILIAEIDRLIENPLRRAEMKERALAFARADSAEKIAEQIMAILLRHQSLIS
ncbi:MAG: UDP-N-acetylglucosamine--N-acetylmuramyl-(pentapeptide) pyrophosphoryl-undecaprenol N-acetylglucosamine transferase [Candidatus Yonathbacteria bacterium]|nr:UDP-N-acetylglucosamine--N-acetylmuramyl-(pentapeptide) pyrophosphoryl-undecaprenol N-acetylglucosamine transferase [Candidatus Yonathbacteria bacterium]